MDEDLNAAAAHCPACGTEYRAGFDTCADDGTPLVPGPAPEPAPEAPPAPTAPEPRRTWRAVATFHREDEARLLAGRLEAEGIEARVFPEGTSDFYGRGTSAMLGRPWEVLVPEGREDEAARVIEEVWSP
ncbi:MAG: DUF2007 domain-containing protein [Actinomycetota bacterium]